MVKLADLVSIYYVLMSIPIVKGIIKKKMDKNTQEFAHSIPRTGIKAIKSLPTEGMKASQIVKKLEEFETIENVVKKKGNYSGSVFSLDDELVKLNQDASNLFLFADLSTPHMHLYTKQLENEIVAMKLNLFKANSNCCGFTTTGGSESLEMAVLTYKKYFKKFRGITQPEIVAVETIHAAVWKACEFFDIKLNLVELNKHFRVNVKDVAAKITKNTVAIFASCPNYPFGDPDPVKPLADLALKHGIGFHVDMCMGGFLVPFVKENGYKLEEDDYNFTVKGITSISSDPHKYGLSAKGISVLMFSDHSYQKALYFSIVDNQLYVNPGITDAKSGAVVAACWATMMYYGLNGYTEMAKIIFDSSTKLANSVKKIPGLGVIGTPIVSVNDPAWQHPCGIS